MKKAEKQDLEALAHELTRAYFVDRDYGKLTKVITPQISWFGTGANEVCCSLLDAARYLTQEQEVYNGSFLVSDEWYHVCPITDDLACVMARMTVRTDALTSKLLMELPLRFSVIFVRKNGKWKVCHVHNSVAYQEQGETTYFDREAAHEDYTKVERIAQAIAAEQIESTRNRDLLTGLWNAEGFIRGAEHALAESDAPFAIVRFGVDHFRYINQSYGYDTGDDILKSIADGLEENCGENELCGRIDKDNFALLLKLQTGESPDKRMKRIEPDLIDQRLQGRIQGRVTFSGGIYLVGAERGEAVKDMLDKAMVTQRLNVGTGRGGSYTYFDPESYEWEMYCSSLLEQAPRAMSNREFELYIQPQVDLKTERVVGGEALVRWRKADNTLIMPGDFIPLFEENDFITEFDFYMLDTLCSQMREWLDAGVKLVPISINQSRRHVHMPRYVERFCTIVDRYEIPHELLVFELTESAFVEGDVAVIIMAEELQKQGFRLAIDDFGTGYAALNLLRMVEADILKIDRSLLADVESTQSSQIILRKVAEMAREIGMTVVCEGIENKSQLDYLRGLGCDIGQGFYFFRPMPAEMFREKLGADSAKVGHV